jgi:DNA polymerase-3 subunit delta'
MSHRPLYGHSAIRAQLTASLHAGRLPASLLLQGPRGIGKQRLALWLGQLLVCDRAVTERLVEPCGSCTQCRYALRGQHPDIHWFFSRPRPKDADIDVADVKADLAEAIDERMKADGLWSPPEGLESLYVSTIRALIQMSATRPAMARRAVFVVGDAERMVSQTGSDQAANAFLKLLEEPPSDTTIIITSSEPGSLLPTIRSRVVSVRMSPIAASDVGAFVDDPAVAARLKGISRDDAIRVAQGAPGVLIASESTASAIAGARRMLEAAMQPSGPHGAAERIKVATKQGISGARGGFTDMLDALTVLLHQHARTLASSGGEREARRAAQAVLIVERTKERAQGNVSPQLLASSLVSTLHGLLTS